MTSVVSAKSTWARENLPGIAVAAVAVLLSVLASQVLPALSPGVFAVIGGAVLSNVGALGPRTRPGLGFVAKRVLRVAIVLLGLQIALPQVLALGPRVIVIVLVATGVTFLVTPVIGRWMGVHPGTALLMATGVSVCGAAAVAAMHSTIGDRFDRPGAKGVEDRTDPASALSVVVLYGSLAILILPPLASWIGLTHQQLGLWAGASVHEVAQVAAIGATTSAVVLSVGVIVKLARVILLAPIVATTAFRMRAVESSSAGRKPPVLPLFVAGFLAMVVLRSLGWVPSVITGAVPTVTNALLAAALFGLGAGVDLRALLRGGRKPMLLGAIATVMISLLSLTGVILLN